jgi:D-sedoheptulose 7-phosphate isomerase
MSANVNYGLQTARDMGMLTVGFAGKDGGRTQHIAEYCLTVRSFSIHRIQEVHTTLLHTMWDMVHVLLGAEDII